MKIVPVLYEDDEILVVNKAAGIAVQGGAGIVNSLDSILERQTGQKIYLVHRLDRDTAGILLAAKSSSAAGRLIALISSSEVCKEYTAGCFGAPEQTSGVIFDAVSRRGVEKSAVTSYTVIKSTGKFSLLSVALGTGRTHQIRIHLAGLGNPIVADDKYGDFRRNREVRREWGVKKLQLAATRLTLPLYGKKRTFEIPLPEHLEDFCEKLLCRT